MNTKTLSDAVHQVGNKYINEAITFQESRKEHNWVKWVSAVACLAVIVVASVAVFHNSNRVTLDNGDKINFVKIGTVASSPNLDIDATTRQLTKNETSSIFGSLPVEANALFSKSDNTLMGITGQMGKSKLIISTPKSQLADTAVITDHEKATLVNGVSVIAGRFATKGNSKGQQNVIYYATFKLGDNKVYIENFGEKSKSDDIRSALVADIEKLTRHGAFDFSQL